MEFIKKVQGKADIELNEKGIQQAEETAKKLNDCRIDIIISFPLKRAKQTAENIKAFLNRVYSFLNDIKAKHNGKR